MSPGKAALPGVGNRGAEAGSAGEVKSTSRSSVDARPGITPHCCLDTAHPAYLAGLADGLARGQRLSGQAEADRLLTELANDMEALALCNASTKGPHWRQALLEQARGWD